MGERTQLWFDGDRLTPGLGVELMGVCGVVLYNVHTYVDKPHSFVDIKY